jgi:hypothetical protein
MNVLIKLACALVAAILGLLISIVAVEAVRLLFCQIYGTYYRAFAYPPPAGVLIGAVVSGTAGYRAAPVHAFLQLRLARFQ